MPFICLNLCWTHGAPTTWVRPIGCGDGAQKLCTQNGNLGWAPASNSSKTATTRIGLAALGSVKRTVGTTEPELLAGARARDETAIRVLIKANNQRLFRVARAVLRDDAEAEDVVQATYVKAFTRLDAFRGDSAFSTWLTRIALNEALGRKRRQRPTLDITTLEDTAAPIGVP